MLSQWGPSEQHFRGLFSRGIDLKPLLTDSWHPAERVIF